MPDYKVISADSHIVEAPDLWEKWIDPGFRDRAPRIGRMGVRLLGGRWYADHCFWLPITSWSEV